MRKKIGLFTTASEIYAVGEFDLGVREKKPFDKGPEGTVGGPDDWYGGRTWHDKNNAQRRVSGIPQKML